MIWESFLGSSRETIEMSSLKAKFLIYLHYEFICELNHDTNTQVWIDSLMNFWRSMETKIDSLMNMFLRVLWWIDSWIGLERPKFTYELILELNHAQL